jgi:hypothetical protein
MASYQILTEEVHGITELVVLLQSISTDDKQALRDIKVLQSPREGRFTVIWERKV